MPLIEKKCLQCNKIFKISSYYIKHGKYNCCSHKCASLKRKNKPISDKTKLKISNSLKGRIVSKETRLKISKAHLGKKTGRTPWNKGIFGVVKHPENSGKNNFNWKGGKYLHNGYILKLCRGHHRQNVKGYVLEHILVAEKYINRNIEKNEFIHHINGIKTDNKIKNLYLFSSKSDHHKLHQDTKLKGIILKSNIKI